MKLHLPKLLRVALLSVVCGVSATYAVETYPIVSQDGKYINVGLASKGNSTNNIVTWTEDDLIVSSGMKVGYFSDSWVLSQAHPVINGTPSTEELLAKKISNTLKINGTLTITGDGMVYLGGQCGGNRYTGLIAKEVIVGIAKDEENGVEEVKATGTVQYGGVTTSGSTYNLSATLANIDKLTVNSGAVVFRPNGGTANFKQGDASPTEKGKISWIKDELSVTGGTLYMGHTQGAEPSGYTQHFLNGFGRSGDAAKICQSDGDVYIYGRTYIYSGMELSQTGGTMCIAMGSGKNVNASSLLVFSGATKNVINQEKGTLTLGRIGANNWSSNYNGNVLLEINQTGDGKLYLTDGALYTSKEGSESSIKQTGGGLVQLKGDFTSAVFNVEQSRGTLELSGSAKLRSNSATIDGSLNVSSEAVLRTTDLNLSKSSNITNAGIIVAGSSETGAAKEVLNVTDGGRLNLRDGYGTAAHTEGAIKKVCMTGGELNYTGAVSLESVEMSGGLLKLTEPDNTFSVDNLESTGGVIQMSDKSDSITVNDFSVGQGGKVNYLVTDSSATGTPLTITSAFSVASDAIFELSFTDSYLSTESAGGDTITFTINVADLTGVADSSISMNTGTVTTDCVTWELSNVEWSVTTGESNIGTLSGILTRITDEIVIETESEIVNEVDGAVKLVIKEDSTISSDNTHTGGTDIIDADVVLNSETPLGNGEITTMDTSSIKGSYIGDVGELAALPEAIQNEGDLTIEGQFDGAELVSEIRQGTYVSTLREFGDNGFAVKNGVIITVVENTTSDASLTIGAAGASVVKDGVIYEIFETGEAAELDYTSYRIAEDTYAVKMSDIIANGGSSSTSIIMSAGEFTANKSVNDLQATGGKVIMASGCGSVKGNISGDTFVEVQSGTPTLNGDNTYTGGTSVTGGTLWLGSVKALGAGGLSTSGTAGLTSNSVKAILNSAIQNSGTLTIRGKYDGSKLGIKDLGATYIGVDGLSGNNGFLRDGAALVVVENVMDTATISLSGTVNVYKGDKVYVLGNDGLAVYTDWNTYYLNEAGHEVTMSAINDASNGTPAVEMTAGVLMVDEGSAEVKASGGEIFMQGDVTVDGELSGDTMVTVEDGEATLKGTNTHTGGVYISGATLTVGEENALGAGVVYLANQGKLDLNNYAVQNDIEVVGCELHNAANYDGNLTVSGNLSICGTDANANEVTLSGAGNIKASGSEALTVNKLVVEAGAAHAKQLAVDTTVKESIVLYGGAVLTVAGELNLEDGTVIVLHGAYMGGDTFIELADPDALNVTTGSVTLDNGYGTFTLVDNAVILTGIFDQTKADMAVQGNWGIFTASRAFVNTVLGQRTNTGCIANGRGTVWAAMLGAYHDLAGSDINVKGAAMGVDWKLNERHNVGLALGYTDGEVTPKGLRELDQTGTYMAVYGEHGLRKLSDTSCLSLDWVLAYGQTETDAAGMSWEQDSLQLNARVNWNKKLSERLCMSVFGGLEYFTSDSATVNGMQTGDIQNLRAELGVGANYVAWGMSADAKSGACMGCKTLVLHGEIRYMNDLMRNNPEVMMDGLRGSGENPGRSGVGIDVGATYRINERWSTSANYSYSTMDGSTEHRLNVGASYSF